jgi:hypothetical protein
MRLNVHKLEFASILIFLTIFVLVLYILLNYKKGSFIKLLNSLRKECNLHNFLRTFIVSLLTLLAFYFAHFVLPENLWWLMHILLILGSFLNLSTLTIEFNFKNLLLVLRKSLDLLEKLGDNKSKFKHNMNDSGSSNIAGPSNENKAGDISGKVGGNRSGGKWVIGSSLIDNTSNKRWDNLPRGGTDSSRDETRSIIDRVTERRKLHYEVSPARVDLDKINFPEIKKPRVSINNAIFMLSKVVENVDNYAMEKITKTTFHSNYRASLSLQKNGIIDQKQGELIRKCCVTSATCIEMHRIIVTKDSLSYRDMKDLDIIKNLIKETIKTHSAELLKINLLKTKEDEGNEE